MTRYYKIIGGIARRLPASSTWIAPDDIFEYNGDLTGTGWAEEIDKEEAEVLFSPKIEQKDEEPKVEVIEPDPEEEEEVKPKRKNKK